MFTNYFASVAKQEIQESRLSHKNPQPVQKCRPARPQQARRRSVLWPHVELLSAARTPLADFFNSLSKGGNDDRDRANNPNERPVDGFGKIGGSIGQPVAEHPVGIAAKPCRLSAHRLSDRAFLELDEIQAGKRVYVGSLQSTCAFEYEAGDS